MPDVFISYSTQDERLAQFVLKHLTSEGLSVFLASVSLEPGVRWAPEILSNLKTSSWVFFLASQAACSSAFVQQELGGALLTDKKIIPIVWDMQPSNLPGWIKQFQALNLAGATLDQAKEAISKIAEKIKSDKVVGAVAVGAVFAALLYFAFKK